MPGYVIHLAVAEKYIEKHKNDIENYNEFIEGVIFPDSIKDKLQTHFGNGSSKSNLVKFLDKYSLDSSFNKGYFIHLLTDYLFYNKYIDTFSNDIYNDYDILNKELINKYHVTIPDKVKNQVFFKDTGSLKLLSMNLVDSLINEISNLDINMIAEEIKNNPKKWTNFRELKKI